MLSSYIAAKVVVVANDMVLSWLSEEEVVYIDEFFISILLSSFLLTLRSIKSEIKAGFVILLSSTSIFPVSILTTEDMDGRCFGDS